MDCGLLQRSTSTPATADLRCARCSAIIRRAPSAAPALGAAATLLACLLGALALIEPLFELRLLGRFASATPLAGPQALLQRGVVSLAGVVAFTLFAAPWLHLALVALGVVCTRLRRLRRWMVLPLGLLESTRRWAMIDVYLLAALVCYVRLRSWSEVVVGSGLISAVAFVFIAFTAESSLDVDGLWRRVPVRVSARPEGMRIACNWCGLVQRSAEGQGCVRCGHELCVRRRDPVTRTLALLVTAALLCVPANLLSVMAVTQFGHTRARTILGGVVELTQLGMWGLSALIFTASILVPLLKIAGLGLLMWMTWHGRADYLVERTRLYRALRRIGRWSLVDVFAVTILVSLVHMGRLASVTPRSGAVAFGAAVVLTMLATEAFDPRVMWDAAGFNGPLNQEQRR